MARIHSYTAEFIEHMKESCRIWGDRYNKKALEIKKSDVTTAKIYELASNAKLYEKIIFGKLEEIVSSINELYDTIPSEKRIISSKTKSKDTAVTKEKMTQTQLKELDAREKRASTIYG
jgi:hypothetical protein